MSKDLTAIRQCFFQMNRIMTWSLVIAVAAVSAVLWLLGYAGTDAYSIRIGLSLMGLAVIFYKLPYISYLYTRRRFKHHPEAREVFAGGWKSFSSWVNQV